MNIDIHLYPCRDAKSRGHILRLAAVLHMLFHIESSESNPLPDEVSEVAICAAINLVKLSAQQVVYIAGKGVLQEEYQKFKTGKGLHELCNKAEGIRTPQHSYLRILHHFVSYYPVENST